jgi:hypothetical protein
VGSVLARAIRLYNQLSPDIKNSCSVAAFEHKNAAFNSMAHRMCNFQLSPQNYENEKKKILEIGRVNGYPANQIQKKLFYPGITNKIGKVFKRNDIQMVCSSSEY